METEYIAIYCYKIKPAVFGTKNCWFGNVKVFFFIFEEYYFDYL
ncbi:hypothetical protein SALWKB2_1404 [Snodgrassella alvi wkB2]|nr:hypothetical protein SALWKB2_1404 [Snodgrassella alvi wkB2]